MMKIRLVLLLMLFLFAKAFANECTCEMEEIIDENADAINIAISKYKDIVYKRHKFDKSRYEVFVTPTFYSRFRNRHNYNNRPPYLQDIYALSYSVVNKADSIMYDFEWDDVWYNGITPIEHAKKTYLAKLLKKQIELSKMSVELHFVLSSMDWYDVWKTTNYGICIVGKSYNETKDICDTWNDIPCLLQKRGLKEMLICHLHTESVKKFIARMDSVMGKTSFDNTTGSMALKFKPCRSKKLTDKFLENLNVEHPVLIRHNEYDAFIDSIKPEYSFYIYGDKDFSLFYVKNKKLRVLCHPDRGDKSVVKDFSYEAYYQTFVGKTRF